MKHSRPPAKSSPAAGLEPLEQRQLMAVTPYFKVASLTSNSAAVPATNHDANLVNGWGLAVGPGTALWVANNGTGVASVYDGDGVANSLVVTIPGPAGASAPSVPTGEVYNGTSGFTVGSNQASRFIFATEDGAISGWAPGADATHALIKIDNSSKGAVYKGLAIGTFAGHEYIYATNFQSGKVEVYDSNWQPAHPGGSFRDAKLPAGYAPFGIQNINGLIYVTYAAQDLYGEGDISGKGHGFVDVYLPDGTLSRRLAKRGTLNSPWGVARIPGGFGKYKRDIAIGNFGDGMIQVFDPHTGEFRGYLRKAKNKHAIQIDGLWSLQFGNGAAGGATNELFFTAGPNGETDGLFGKLSMVAPKASAGLMVQAESSIAMGNHANLFGSGSVSHKDCAVEDLSGMV